MALLTHEDWKHRNFARMYSVGTKGMRTLGYGHSDLVQQVRRFKRKPMPLMLATPDVVECDRSIDFKLKPGPLTQYNDGWGNIIMHRQHDGARPHERKQSHIVTTVSAALCMGGIHQVHWHGHMKRQTTFHLGYPEGMDVTVQVKTLLRSNRLKGLTYKTWDWEDED